MQVQFSEQAEQQQVVLILVGLVGSGKSTFAEALQTYYPHYRRCNQDDLGDRRAVEALARASLRDRFSVCIDRTNFDENQRATWVRIAREFPGILVQVLNFDTPFEVCEQRLRTRTSHPTITSAEQGIEVLNRFASLYRPPRPHEGFDQIFTLHINDQPPEGYSRADVETILDRLKQSPRIPSSAWASQASADRGGYRRGYGQYQRGHYGGRGSWSSGSSWRQGGRHDSHGGEWR